jgi:peptidoglycan hydrolase CwlO-like protein
MDVIEIKLEKMCRELDFIQKENYSLRVNEEKYKGQINTLDKKLLKKNEKCQNLTHTVNTLENRIKELENIVNERKVVEEKKTEEIKKNKSENKKKVIYY